MTYKIPLFDLNFDKKEEEAVIETLRSKWISMGPKTSEFEERFAQMLQTEYAVALSNCTVALHLAMKLLDIKPEDEVICPSLTFVATVNAIRYVGAIPVFADIKSYDDLTIDPVDIESKITKKTKAIVVMHYGGFACDMDSIMSVANEYGLKVIEDACHGPLSEYKGNKLGTIGDVGCFSFFSNKNISTGEGGMLITNNPEYFEKAKLLRSHGMTSLSFERAKGHSTDYDVIDLGYNYRMDDIRAAIGIVQLSKLRNDLSKREELRNYYLNKLAGLKNITIPFREHKYFSSNYIFVVMLNHSTIMFRDHIRKKLAEVGIQTSVHYPAVHRFSMYQRYSLKLPKTDYASNNLITLPLFSKLEKSQVDFIVSNLRELINE